jgi:phage tail-like protein
VPQESPPGGSDPPFTVARFSLTIDGVEIAQFSEVAISSEVEPLEIREQSGDTLILKMLPGKPLLATLTFKRGMTSDTSMSAWHESVVEAPFGKTVRKNCTVTMFDASGEPVARYALESAWPSKIEIGALKDDKNEILIETVTLVCDSLRRVEP